MTLRILRKYNGLRRYQTGRKQGQIDEENRRVTGQVRELSAFFVFAEQ